MARERPRRDHDLLDDLVQRALSQAPRVRRWVANLGRPCELTFDRKGRRIELAATPHVLVLLIGGLLGLLVLIATSAPAAGGGRSSTARLRAMPPRPEVMELGTPVRVADAE
jgi:hypothetical protein